MTTILVTKDNEMYSDSRITIGDFIVEDNSIKIEKINGHLVGVAGLSSSCIAFRDWFREVQSVCTAIDSFPDVAPSISIPELREEEYDQFSALVLSPEGNLTLFEGSYTSYVVSKPYAIGSGSAYAFCALDAGADGRTALEVAIKRDIRSGGDIVKISLEDKDGNTSHTEEIKYAK